MTTKLIVLASLVAMTGAHLGPPVSFGYTIGHGYLSPVVPYAAPSNDSKTDAASQIHVDPIIAVVYDYHKTFVEKQRLKPPYLYSYGHEVYNWRTRLTQSHYEVRYGDLAIGTYIVRAHDGSRTIVDYTVDTPNGFYGVVRNDFLGQPVNFGYARLAGPLAFTAHPAPDEYASRTTLLADPGGDKKLNPLVQVAFTMHNLFVNYMNLEAPFRYSAGYELRDGQTGNTRSQYETYHGEIGEGSYTQVDVAGTRISIDYSMSPAGFAVTSPTTVTSNPNPM